MQRAQIKEQDHSVTGPGCRKEIQPADTQEALTSREHFMLVWPLERGRNEQPLKHLLINSCSGPPSHRAPHLFVHQQPSFGLEEGRMVMPCM